MRSGNYLMACNQIEPDGVAAMMCDANGSVLWVRAWDAPVCMSFCTGEFNNGDPYVLWWDSAPDPSLHVVRLDPNGNVIWQRSYPSASGDVVYMSEAFVVPDGVPDAGTLRVFEHARPTAILEIGENGELLSHVSYDDDVDPYEHFGGTMAPTSDGGTVVCGQSEDVPVIFKLDQFGGLSWKRRLLLNEGMRSAYAVEQTNDGGFLVICHTQAWGRSVIVKLTGGAEFLWARTIEVFSNGASPTEIVEDENGDLFLTGAGTVGQCTYWLSGTGDMLASSIIRDDNWWYVRDLDWIELSSGEATAVAVFSLHPTCLYASTLGLGLVRGPADLPLSCYSEPLTLVYGDHGGEIDTLVAISSSPASTTPVITVYQPVAPTPNQWDLCAITSVETVSSGETMPMLWPDPARAGELLHVNATSATGAARLLDNAGRTLPCSLLPDGAGRYVLDTKALIPGHYTLVFVTSKGPLAKPFVILE